MRGFLTLLIAAASFYVLLALMLFLFQEKMVFLPNMPGRTLTATPKDAGFDFEDVTLETSDGLKLHGWYVPAAQARGVVLFLHGNAGNISHRLDSIAIFHELGLDTLIIDYRGYGRSQGKPSERGIYLDAEAAWHYLVSSRGVAADRVIVFGRSLGGAVAAWLANQYTPAALIIESSFSSALDIARKLYPFMPVRLITRLEFPVSLHVSRLQCPLLVVHSRDDEIIPFTMAEAIYESAAEPKSLLEIWGDHNNGFLLSRDRYLSGLNEFIQKNLPQ
ncbi:multifunctional-autoprocessing repeats-in-toxin [bacterium MnTg04]|nr:multifunctional-autoprocessing repeats-in-toxin [bacterium MnTg04]